MKCAQCGSRAPLTPTEYGDLCDPCAFRQAEYGDRRDSYSHLSPGTFGFLYDDE